MPFLQIHRQNHDSKSVKHNQNISKSHKRRRHQSVHKNHRYEDENSQTDDEGPDPAKELIYLSVLLETHQMSTSERLASMYTLERAYKNRPESLISDYKAICKDELETLISDYKARSEEFRKEHVNELQLEYVEKLRTLKGYNKNCRDLEASIERFRNLICKDKQDVMELERKALNE
ncbi:hypothetical protein BU26DRAFT_507873 [Trematosphaeria pertusa]|uniref:Uncharacterized protein n=1 Tax=Trematosphaeria pertusa TaxID=390896 RepID=A0A6A6I6W5_9PLEO|nr:uncharacterized protein BU26DRAFT_507873 [Trematosphaeria pertusa]KAF2246265.1 hypothetical protein BU26DRAFT_507873 [Trematosphaeria pertusa]